MQLTTYHHLLYRLNTASSSEAAVSDYANEYSPYLAIEVRMIMIPFHPGVDFEDEAGLLLLSLIDCSPSGL